MANLTKTYTIQIEMDAAQQTLADANKRLNELDGRLQGLDRNSDEAKAIVAEMAKIVSEVNSATSAVEGLAEELDNLKPGSMGALKQQAVDLEKALDAALVGTAEHDELIQQLGKVKAEIKEIDERVDVAFSRDKAGALVDAVSGLAGAFSVATVAAQTFGLSSSTAEEYQQKLTELIAVVQGVEQIHKLTTGEVRQALKNVVTDGKRVILGYLGIGEAATASGTAAKTSANTTRIALASLGITAVLLILGLVVSNWDKITAAVKRNRESIVEALKYITPPIYGVIKLLDFIEKKFGSLSAFAAGVGAAFKQAFSNLGDVLTGAEAQGVSVAEAFHRGVLKKQQQLSRERAEALIKLAMESNARLIKEEEAAGKETTALKRQQLADELGQLQRAADAKLELQEELTAEEKKALLEKQSELRAFDNAEVKKLMEQEQAQDVARLNARIARAQAAGKQVFDLTIALRRKELDGLLAQATQDKAAILAAQGALDAAILAKKKDAADKAAAAEKARLQKEYEAFKERVLATDKLAFLTIEESERRRAEARQQAHDKYADLIAKGTQQKLAQLQTEAEARAKIGIPVGLYDTVLIRMFGVTPGQLDATKGVIDAAVGTLMQSANLMAGLLLDAAYENVQARIDSAQLQLQAIDDRLNAATTARQGAEAALVGAAGARRDFLLAKINREREAEERLARQKDKAAAAEQKALREKMRLEQQAAKISAAAALASNIAANAKVLETGFNLVSGAAKLPFPASLVAVLAAVAALASITLQIRGLAKMENGGDLPGGVVEGPSHAQGGVRGRGAFSNIEVEGGEKIVNKRATANNRGALHLINTVGRTRTLLPEDFARAASFRVLPSAPQRQYANGGDLPTSANNSAGGSSTDSLSTTNRVDALEAKVEETNALLRVLVSYGPAVFQIGYSEATQIGDLRDEAKASGNPVKVGG